MNDFMIAIFKCSKDHFYITCSTEKVPIIGCATIFCGFPDQLWKVITSYTTALCDNFPGFSCWGDFILNKFQNHFGAC